MRWHTISYLVFINYLCIKLLFLTFADVHFPFIQNLIPFTQSISIIAVVSYIFVQGYFINISDLWGVTLKSKCY